MTVRWFIQSIALLNLPCLLAARRCPSCDESGNADHDDGDEFEWDGYESIHYKSSTALVRRWSPVVTYPLVVEISS